MDQDTDLFVQAFWVKCREVIRPEIDARSANCAAPAMTPMSRPRNTPQPPTACRPTPDRR